MPVFAGQIPKIAPLVFTERRRAARPHNLLIIKGMLVWWVKFDPKIKLPPKKTIYGQHRQGFPTEAKSAHGFRRFK